MKQDTSKLLPSLGLTALVLAAAPARSADVYDSGHGDIGVAYEGGALEPHWHLHAGAGVNGAALPADAEYAPDALVANVPSPSIARPAGSVWDFTGTPAGSPLWYLPQVQDPAKPFLGIASEELDPADWSSLKFSLVQFSGPQDGQFSLWQADLFGNPDVKMATGNGVGAEDAFLLPPGGHAHFNYGFTTPGEYSLTFRWDGDHKADGLVTASATYSFSVAAVPEPGTGALLALGALAWAACARGSRQRRPNAKTGSHEPGRGR